MNKKEMTEYLNTHGVLTADLDWKAIQKTYWEKKRDNNELPSNGIKSTHTEVKETEVKETTDASTNVSEVTPEVRSIPPGLNSQRDKLMPEIITLMKELAGKSKGTSEQVQLLISLHNRFYLRHDSVGCSTCVGTVHNRMKALYKKYKEYYD